MCPVLPCQRNVLSIIAPEDEGDVYLMRGWGPSGGQQLQQDNGTHSGFLLAVTDAAALFVDDAGESGLEFQSGQQTERQSYSRGRTYHRPV